MKILQNYIEDVLIILGMLLIVFATYLLSYVAAIYVLGAFLFALGIFFAYKPPTSKRR
ncbi:hypothetical protein [Alkalihalophilus marmarensis]|uniref:DUF1056 family protein n=1 Tax=Alkalihalophilus marmarensis DSM 21297 TaxID=1188261 RepID=U6STW8_9BACI|nr:hypothetical protein [Alkalihalophilus marmarensis]ERN54320.1 hypothetical protein A33I_07815 [Alkalihalophilus marmarensis DSM 21297]